MRDGKGAWRAIVDVDGETALFIIEDEKAGMAGTVNIAEEGVAILQVAGWEWQTCGARHFCESQAYIRRYFCYIFADESHRKRDEENGESVSGH